MTSGRGNIFSQITRRKFYSVGSFFQGEALRFSLIMNGVFPGHKNVKNWYNKMSKMGNYNLWVIADVTSAIPGHIFYAENPNG
jgi:hypothetical protein